MLFFLILSGLLILGQRSSLEYQQYHKENCKFVHV